MTTGQAGKTIVKRIGLSEQTYEAIKEKILDQVIAPGERINIDRLVSELGVSTSPIREALSRLNAEKLIIMEPYVGYSAAPIPDDEWFLDMIDFRIMFEGHSALIGAPDCSDAILGEMKESLVAMKSSALGSRYRKFRSFSDADASFHRAIVSSTRNRINIQVYENLQPHIHHARLYLDRGAERQETTEHQHLAIYNAFLARDGGVARERLIEHLESTRTNLLKTAARLRETPKPKPPRRPKSGRAAS